MSPGADRAAAAEPLRITRERGLVRISLARPPLNILSRPLNQELATAVRAQAGDRDVAVIVLDGGDAKGFSAGVEVADHTRDKVSHMLVDFHAAVRALWEAGCPTIAAVHGFAVGGGLELAMACDMVVAERDARLGFPEIALGCYPPVAAAVLPRRTGLAFASEAVLTGEPFDAERGHAMGIVNRVCDPGGLETSVRSLTDALLLKSPAVLREAKKALREGARPLADDALRRIERHYLESLMSLEDADEGIRAFMEKRPPAFKNR